MSPSEDSGRWEWVCNLDSTLPAATSRRCHCSWPQLGIIWLSDLYWRYFCLKHLPAALGTGKELTDCSAVHLVSSILLLSEVSWPQCHQWKDKEHSLPSCPCFVVQLWLLVEQKWEQACLISNSKKGRQSSGQSVCLQARGQQRWLRAAVHPAAQPPLLGTSAYLLLWAPVLVSGGGLKGNQNPDWTSVVRTVPCLERTPMWGTGVSDNFVHFQKQIKACFVEFVLWHINCPF